jgi:hypothetical protein
VVADGWRDDAGTLGGAAVGLLAAGLVLRVGAFFPLAVIAFGGEYTLFLLRSDGIDASAPVLAAAVVLVTETAYASVGAARVPLEGPMLLRRAAAAVAVAVGAGAVAVFLLAVSQVRASGGLGLQALGMAAAAGVLVAILFLARAAGQPEGRSLR